MSTSHSTWENFSDSISEDGMNSNTEAIVVGAHVQHRPDMMLSLGAFQGSRASEKNVRAAATRWQV